MLRTIIPIILFFIVGINLASAGYSKDDEKRIKKEKSEFMKQLKTGNNLSHIELKFEPDNSYWYLLRGKNDKYGAANMSGEIIIPTAYREIEYLPAVEEGFVYDQRYAKNIWRKSSVAVFLANNRSDASLLNMIYDLYLSDGTKKLEGIVSSMVVGQKNGYLDFSNDDSKTRGLYTQDGELLLPIEYNLLEIDGKVCVYTKFYGESGRHLCGAIMLDKSAPVVPAEFERVEYRDGKWMVKRMGEYKMVPYTDDDSQSNMAQVRDQGVELFLEGKYDDVLDFYSKNGIGNPWAKFYSACALLEKAGKIDLDLSTFISVSENEAMDKPYFGNLTLRETFTDLYIDFNLLRNLYSTGYEMMYAYMEEDSTFRDVAKNKTSINLDWRLNKITEDEAKFNVLWKKYQDENKAIIAEEQRRKKEAQNEMLMSIVGFFANALVNSVTSYPSSQRTSGATVSAQSQRSVGEGKSSTSSSSSQNLGPSSSQSQKKQVKCKACGGTGIWVDERLSGEEKWCDQCKKMRKPHTHKTCGSCKGTGFHN